MGGWRRCGRSEKGAEKIKGVVGSDSCQTTQTGLEKRSLAVHCLERETAAFSLLAATHPNILCEENSRPVHGKAEASFAWAVRRELRRTSMNNIAISIV